MNRIKSIKHRIKKSKLVQLWLRSCTRENIKARQLNKNPQKFSNFLFKKHYHRDINWDNPEIFDEKLMILKCTEYLDNELVVQCADKYRVREYVKKCGLEMILNDLYNVWDSVDQIDVESLPNQFVLKRNNDAGGVLVVKDKTQEEKLQERILKLGEKQNRKYGVVTGELHYQKIKSCVICEKYIGEEDGSFPYDYKFFCMNGKVRCVLVCIGRESKNTLDRFVVDSDFHLLDIMPNEPPHTDNEIQQYKPALLKQMIDVAEKLASPFPFVRVDLYEFQNEIIFGELTFTPMGCINDYFSDEGQRMLGVWLSITNQGGVVQ